MSARAEHRRAVARRWLAQWAEDGVGRQGPPAVQRAMARFVEGYRAALDDIDLHGGLDAPPFADPFAVEGAGMALAGLDALDPDGPSALAGACGRSVSHDTLLALGAGMARGRLDRPGALRGLPVALTEPARDGQGFFVGLFRWIEAAARTDVDPARDRGVGRSLWFSTGADAAAILDRIEALPAARRPAVWCGVGLASVFAGGDPAARDTLRAHGPRDAFDAGVAQAHALRRAFAAVDAPRISDLDPPGHRLGGPHETA